MNDDADAQTTADLLELLYLLPFAVAKTDATGAVNLMNPLGAQLLFPLAPAGDLSNIFDVFALTAPELQEMVGRFPGRAGRVCDEYRVITHVGTGERARTFVLSVTIQKIDEDVLVIVISDVTSEAQREELLRLHEARLHALFDGMRDYGICTVDAGGHVTSWNRSAEALDGYRADEIIGAHATVLLPSSPVSSKGFNAGLATALREGSYSYEGWRVRKNGTRYWANCVISVLRDRVDESHLGFSVITRDHTEHKRSEERLRALAITDPLTGAVNRRGLFDAGLREDERRKRAGGTTSLLLLDIDHFKLINDRYGHSIGDDVLRHIVALVKSEIRAVDVVGRYGGEEFAVLLPGSPFEGARAIAERIRRRIEATPLETPAGAVSVTISVGVAGMSARITDLPNLIGAADAALYEAKTAGRNRIALAATP